MGGFFGIAAQSDCIQDLFYGTDYHSHLGTQRGGLAVFDGHGFRRIIHDIRHAPFRTKFGDNVRELRGSSGIGVISDYEDQPLLISSHLGTYAIVTVGVIRNLDALVQTAFRSRLTHFSEMSNGAINPTELVATLINSQDSFAEGLRYAQMTIEGSCSILLLTPDCVYAARDRWGRTPITVGQKPGAHAVSFESCALPNLDYRPVRQLGPGEIVRVEADGFGGRAPRPVRAAHLRLSVDLLRLPRIHV